jgi:hypothetical protein
MKKNIKGESYFPDLKLSATILGGGFLKRTSSFLPIMLYSKAQPWSLEQGERGKG